MQKDKQPTGSYQAQKSKSSYKRHITLFNNSKTSSTKKRVKVEDRIEDIYHHNPADKIMIFRKHINYSYFGEEDIIKKKSRSCNAVCTTDCEMYTLDKVELENIIKSEYPLIYETITKYVLEKENKDYATKKQLVDIYQQFDEIDLDKLTNTLTVAEEKCVDDVPDLRDIYQESIVKHPIEILLGTFDQKKYEPNNEKGRLN